MARNGSLVIKGQPGRPTIPREQKRIGFSLYLKAEVLEAIEADAAAHGNSTQVHLRNFVEGWALALLSKQRDDRAAPTPPTTPTEPTTEPTEPTPPAEETEMAV